MKKRILFAIIALTLVVAGFMAGRYHTIFTEIPYVVSETQICIDHNGRLDWYYAEGNANG